MKMSNEDYNIVLTAFNSNTNMIQEHYNNIKASGEYKVLEKRVAWDVCKYLLGTKFIIGLYDKGLSDKHINTGIIKALKETIELN